MKCNCGDLGVVQHLLVSTASGVVGAGLSEPVGIVLLGLFEAALSEQATLPPHERWHYLVLIDESQVYRGTNYQGMLAELRKYGGSFALATQSLAYLDRLDRTPLATVLANIDTSLPSIWLGRMPGSCMSWTVLRRRT